MVEDNANKVMNTREIDIYNTPSFEFYMYVESDAIRIMTLVIESLTVTEKTYKIDNCGKLGSYPYYLYYLYSTEPEPVPLSLLENLAKYDFIRKIIPMDLPK